MPYQLSVWLDDQTARDLEALSRFEERKRGPMIKLLIRRAARQLSRADDKSGTPSGEQVQQARGTSARMKA